MLTLEVISPGFFTTVQDLGRRGYRQFGLPRGGAADVFALQVANVLVGNPHDAAGLECTATGPALRLLRPALLSCTGAGAPCLNGELLPSQASFHARVGDLLAIRPAPPGLRAYLAVSGGIDVPVVMSSRSTCLKAGFGGHQGRPLRAGDVLSCEPRRGGRPARAPTGEVDGSGPLRVILGPQDDRFTREGLATLLHSEYRVTHECDRMGCRLQGPPIGHAGPADIVSDGVPEGSLQVPAGGQPILMLCDGQPTGGYAKPAVVISADLGRVAQLVPGSAVTFSVVNREQARAAREAQRRYLARVEDAMRAVNSYRSFRVHLQGRSYHVEVEELP